VLHIALHHEDTWKNSKVCGHTVACPLIPTGWGDSKPGLDTMERRKKSLALAKNWALFLKKYTAWMKAAYISSVPHCTALWDQKLSGSHLIILNIHHVTIKSRKSGHGTLRCLPNKFCTKFHEIWWMIQKLEWKDRET
jgi:hypothetical protein